MPIGLFIIGEEEVGVREKPRLVSRELTPSRECSLPRSSSRLSRFCHGKTWLEVNELRAQQPNRVGGSRPRQDVILGPNRVFNELGRF